MATKDPNILQAIGDQIGGVLHAMDPREAMLGLLGNANASNEKVIGNPSQMKLTTNITPNALSTPTPTATAAPAILGASQGGFKYQMGKSDYSDIAPQVQAALKGTPLEAYTNDFIQAGNKHGVDPRVLITVANNESSLGKHYPHPGDPAYASIPNMQDTYNPFGYLVNPTTGHGIQDVYNGAKNAGFTSIPMAIDALTGRFQRQPTAHYQQFYKDPTVENLQGAYNATPKEGAGWIQNGKAFTSKFH